MLSKELTTLEQSRKLYELGFRRPAVFYRKERTGDLPAYLLSQITDALPDDLDKKCEGYKIEIDGKDDMEAAYELLVWCIEKGYVTLTM